MAPDLCGYKLALVASFKMKYFKLKNEASRANLNKNKRIFKWQPFWNKVYCFHIGSFCFETTGNPRHVTIIKITAPGKFENQNKGF